MARQYVTYEQVRQGLHREYPLCTFNGPPSSEWECDPRSYLKTLRRETGLSWAKLAHDLSVDSGLPVSEANARRWAR